MPTRKQHIIHFAACVASTFNCDKIIFPIHSCVAFFFSFFLSHNSELFPLQWISTFPISLAPFEAFVLKLPFTSWKLFYIQQCFDIDIVICREFLLCSHHTSFNEPAVSMSCECQCEHLSAYTRVARVPKIERVTFIYTPL